MAAIPNKVTIGDEANPILTFYNDSIISISEETATALIGDELFIDQFVPEVRYGLLIRYAICPADREVYNQIITADGLVLCGKYNYDIRALPYGTPIQFYSNNKIAGRFYCESVERVNKETFKINCVSAIGLMDRQRHYGDVYNGERFDAVLREIVGDEYEYQIDPEVGELQVFGWLPYSTRRQNLHHLLVASGVNIVKSDTCGMLFSFIKGDVEAEKIPNNRIFEGGKVSYGEPASRVEVLEHGYHYLSSVDYEVLYDTRGDLVEDALVTFDKPIYAESLTVEDSSSLAISSYGTNYAVVSGSGVLKGQPYVHTTKRLTVDNENAVTEKIVTVEDATLVTMANAENVLSRLAAYFFNATTVTNSIKLDNERTGKRSDQENAFNEQTTAFLAKMSTRVTSFAKAECEFIADYTPTAQGSAFRKRALLELSDDEQIWYVPESVYAKDVPQIRVVLIGEGYDGTSGSDGEDGKYGNDDRGGLGGTGGKGGVGGAGGKILSATIDCSNLAFLKFGRTGKNTWLWAGNKYFNSVNGMSSPSGFVDMFTGAVYGLPGSPGIDGAPGGEGGAYPPVGSSGNLATDGGNVEFEGTVYKGGKKSDKQAVRAKDYGNNFSENMTWCFGGCGGGGAAVGANGHDAGELVGEGHVEHWPYGGDGADASMAEPTAEMYGAGGPGGNGGGGGGGASNQYWWNDVYTTLISITTDSVPPGKGGKGSAGTKGYPGCIIIYY